MGNRGARLLLPGPHPIPSRPDPRGAKQTSLTNIASEVPDALVNQGRGAGGGFINRFLGLLAYVLYVASPMQRCC